MTDSISIISCNIIEIRDALGLSQKKFAELVGISPATLVNIESGRKSFKIKSLDGIAKVLFVPLQQLSSVSFKPEKNFREKLIKLYEKNPEINVILNSNPTIAYGIKQKVLTTEFLNIPRETVEIRKYLEKNNMVFKGNSIHLTLKRMPDSIKIEPHPSKKGTFLYSKK